MDKLLMILAGIALFFFGLEGPVVSLLGTETAGQVVSVEPQSSEEATSVKDWVITYRFRTKSGKLVTGTETRNQVYNTSSLPSEGGSLRVRYVEALPILNESARNADLSMGHLGVMAIGLVLITVGVLGTRRSRGSPAA